MAFDAFITLEILRCLREFDLPFFNGTQPALTALSICRSRLPPTRPGEAEQPRSSGPVIGVG